MQRLSEMNLRILIVLAIALFACKKEVKAPVEEPVTSTELKQGLPDNLDKVSGFLVTYMLHEKSGSNNWAYSYMTADFCDPGKNILTGYNHYYNSWLNDAYRGNVSVGAVTMMVPLYEQTGGSSSFRYFRNLDAVLPDSITWTVSGEAFIPGSTYKLAGAPLYKIDSVPAILYKSKGLTMRFNPTANRYDSACVIIQNWGSGILRKAVGRSSELTITPEELKEFTATSSNYYSINIYLFNYSHIIVNNRLLVFENARRFYRNLTIYN